MDYMSEEQKVEFNKLKKRVTSCKRQVIEEEVENARFSEDRVAAEILTVECAIVSVVYKKRQLEDKLDNVELRCGMELRQMISSHCGMVNVAERMAALQVHKLEIERRAALAAFNPHYNPDVIFDKDGNMKALCDLKVEIAKRKKVLSVENEAAAQLSDEDQLCEEFVEYVANRKFDHLKAVCDLNVEIEKRQKDFSAHLSDDDDELCEEFVEYLANRKLGR